MKKILFTMMSLLSLNFGGNLYAQANPQDNVEIEIENSFEVANVLSGDDYRDGMTRKMMRVDNGELLFVTKTPGLTVSLDCSKELFQLTLMIFDMEGEKFTESYSFDSSDKCQKVADLIMRHKDKLSYDSTIKFILSSGNNKIKKVSFPR